jgi:hypothetical protein
MKERLGKLTKAELLAIGEAITRENPGVAKPDRLCRRQKGALICWYAAIWEFADRYLRNYCSKPHLKTAVMSMSTKNEFNTSLEDEWLFLWSSVDE